MWDEQDWQDLIGETGEPAEQATDMDYDDEFAEIIEIEFGDDVTEITARISEQYITDVARDILADQE